MPRYIELNMIIPARQAHIYDETEVDTGEDGDGEDDGFVQLRQEQEHTTPAMVNADHIKSFYRRKKRPDGTVPVGTRINFINGTGMAVTNLYQDVQSQLNAH
jgi:hypothetical protein